MVVNARLSDFKIAGNGSTPQRPILSLTQLLDIRAEEQGDLPAIWTLISEDTDKGEWVVRTLTYAGVRKAIERLAWYYSREPSPANPNPNLRLSLNEDGSPPPPTTVGLFLNTSLTLTFTEFALHRLGLTSLLISPNNSAAAVASLLQKTDSHVIIVGERLRKTGEEAVKRLREQGYRVTLIAEKVFPFWGKDGLDEVEVPRYPSLLTPRDEHDRPAIILHSSGSTGFPKPLPGIHRTVIANGAMNWGLVGATVLPLFHGFGHYSTLRCISGAKPLAVFPPHLPLTADNIVRFFKASEEQTGKKLQQLFAVAYILKLLSENKEACNYLSQFDLVAFAGSAVPDEVGDRLTEAGVRLVSQYGTTETGGVMTSVRDFDNDKLWNYLSPIGKAVDFLQMEERGEGLYEAVVYKGMPSLAVSNQPDGSFATRDLFVRHPDHPKRWKYVGRLDDTLTQTLGEKTNPVPIELTIRGLSEYVSQAIVFGDGRPNIGCLIWPSENARGLTREELFEKVWPAVEAANKDAPSHSQLIPEMVESLDIDADVPMATKGSILRPACYAAFKDLIEAIYERYESGTSENKRSLPLPELEVFLMETLARVMGEERTKDLKPTDDLFNFGVDSLQSMRIRLICLKELDLGGKELGQNVVYDHPSVVKLAAHLYDLETGEGTTDAEATAQQQHQVMFSLVDKYSSSLVRPTPPSPTRPSPSGHVVVLTGATGSLGAHIVHQLLSREDVEKVVCLVRAHNDEKAMERVEESLKLRMLPSLDGFKNGRERVDAYAADLDLDKLGLREYVYEEIKESATSVIHNAWTVNFNYTVESFEAANIRGAFNLLNLCLRSPHARPASFYFSSSVSAMQGKWCEDEVDEVITDDPAYAAPTGYARSKWITEKICERGAEERGVHVGVLRIGQMVGDSVSGVWNTTEAIPLLFRSAQVINALPDIDDHPSFLPTDVAARGIAEVVGAGDLGSTSRLYHIVNPNTITSWRELYNFLGATGLKFDIVDRQEWVKRLSEGPSDPQVNPTYKLLDFYKNRYGRSEPLRRALKFGVTETSKVAPSIAAAPPVSKELVQKWVQRWREAGFLT